MVGCFRTDDQYHDITIIDFGHAECEIDRRGSLFWIELSSGTAILNRFEVRVINSLYKPSTIVDGSLRGSKWVNLKILGPREIVDTVRDVDSDTAAGNVYSGDYLSLGDARLSNRLVNRDLQTIETIRGVNAAKVIELTGIMTVIQIT